MMKTAAAALLIALCLFASCRRVAVVVGLCEPDARGLLEYGCAHFGFCSDRARVFEDPETGAFLFVDGRLDRTVDRDALPHELVCKPPRTMNR